jgi:hypothetical protein
METERTAFGGGTNASLLHPVILIATILAVILILTLPRRRAVGPFLILTFLGSIGQQLYIAGIHLFVLRILIVAGLLRVFATKKEPGQSRYAGGWNGIDTAYAFWILFHSLGAVLQFRGASGAIIYQVGFIWDALGAYILMRCLIQDEEDVATTVKVFAFIVVVLAIAMTNEKLRNQNIFGYLGGVPINPDIREGSIRAQGASAHAILAGVTGVTVMPMFWWLLFSGKAKMAGFLGWVGSTVMMLTCASSTPLLAYVGAIVAVCFWPLRKSMRTFRWVLVILLIACHLAMKAPVWFLIAHVDLVAGNSGYHRAMLIDQCVRHFWDWWLIGTSTAGWGWDMWDLSNQFVAEADTGGLLTFIFFILVIKRSYSRIGFARKLVEGREQQEWYMWFLGVTLFAHLVSFFGVNYYDHTKIIWCVFLAIITAATAPFMAIEAAKPAKQIAPERVTLSPNLIAHRSFK